MFEMMLNNFAPWMVFLLGAKLVPLPWAVLLSLVVSAIVSGRSIVRRRVHLLNVVTPLFFAAFGLLLLILRPNLSQWENFAQPVSYIAVALVAFGTVIANRPFSGANAREMVAKEYWNSPIFHGVNMRVSSIWGAAFFVAGLSGILASVEDKQMGIVLVIVLRFVIPILSFGAATAFTQVETRKHRSALAT